MAKQKHHHQQKNGFNRRHWMLWVIAMVALALGLSRMVVLISFTAAVRIKPAGNSNHAAAAPELIKLFDDDSEGLFKLVNFTRDDHENPTPYHSSRVFFEDYKEMMSKLRVFVYPCAEDDPFRNIFLPLESEPGGNYASESYFKKALMTSNLVTSDPHEADLFYMPFSISRLRHDPRVGVGGMKSFIRDYSHNISQKWPYWNRTGGSDHFYVACHSIGKTAFDDAPQISWNSIQVVCSSSYFLQAYIPHKDVSIPQIWPRTGSPQLVDETSQRTTLAFFAGKANSVVRGRLVNAWSNDSEIRVHASRIPTPYSEALLHSKYCLHVKGFEVNTARIGDAFFYGCVPVIIANHYDLAFSNVLDWKQFSVVVTTNDIPKLKHILSRINSAKYEQMHRSVMQVRRHFQWHSPPVEFDAFYMVMYQLWLRRHIVRGTFLEDEDVATKANCPDHERTRESSKKQVTKNHPALEDIHI